MATGTDRNKAVVRRLIGEVLNNGHPDLARPSGR
jgi:hypothetical protein